MRPCKEAEYGFGTSAGAKGAKGTAATKGEKGKKAGCKSKKSEGREGEREFMGDDAHEPEPEKLAIVSWPCAESQRSGILKFTEAAAREGMR